MADFKDNNFKLADINVLNKIELSNKKLKTTKKQNNNSKYIIPKYLNNKPDTTRNFNFITHSVSNLSKEYIE